MPTTTKETSYFDKRMQQLEITPEINKIQLFKNDISVKDEHVDILVDTQIFREVPEGIDILVYTLERSTIRIEKQGSRMKKDYSIVRLEKPLVKPNGDTMKYRLPKGAGTHPFFPPWLVDKYEKKTSIETLFLVEGFFKAFKAAMHGADIIGLSSITHMKDKDKGTLHPEILQLMNTCQVKRMVWLTDGDALDITNKELTEDVDLSKRPKGFFASVQTFKNLLDDYDDIEKWFMHIDTDNILQHSKNSHLTREDVKGIDDLLVTFRKQDGEMIGRESDIIRDMTSFGNQPFYFQKFNITFGALNRVYNHFRLRDVKEFYLFHVERRPELKNKEFIFNGTRYQYDEEKSECLVKIPGDAKLYFRVGDGYYKFFNRPNQYKKPEKVFEGRLKSTIVDDHGKSFTRHIPKYETFCNVPEHINFQPIINNCFNIYSPLDYFPDEEECTSEDCPTILRFLRHVFGEKIVSYTDKETRQKKEYAMLDLALDYLQILYQEPQQKLPILCLVSRENETGKTTFANFLRLMLGSNVAIVGNADLSNDFNAHWASKNVVICDETKIDKQHVVEKVKSLSTAKKLFMNAKGRGQVELDCFIKFVLITNNEESFIYLSDEDIRFWVIKVPVLKENNPKIMDQFEDEIEQFLSYLIRRKRVTELKNRMWFHPQLLKTEAMKRVIAYSQPAVEKEMRHFIKELFLDTGIEKIMMTPANIHKEIFRNNSKYDLPYLTKILRENIKVDTYHMWEVEGLKNEYITEEEAVAAAQVKYPDDTGFMIQGRYKKKYKVIRHSYPRFEEVFEDGKKKMKRFEINNEPSRPFVFYRKDFVKPEDNIELDPETSFLATALQPMNGNGLAHTIGSDELPF